MKFDLEKYGQYKNDIFNKLMNKEEIIFDKGIPKKNYFLFFILFSKFLILIPFFITFCPFLN